LRVINYRRYNFLMKSINYRQLHLLQLTNSLELLQILSAHLQQWLSTHKFTNYRRREFDWIGNVLAVMTHSLMIKEHESVPAERFSLPDMFKDKLLFWLLYFLSLVSSFFFFWLFIMFDISLGCLFEWFGDISLLSSHFDEKSSCKNLLAKAGSDEVNGINFTFKDNFKRPRVILFDFDKIELGECFLNIFFNCLEVTFDQVKRNLLNLVTQSFDLIYYLIFARHNKLLLLLSTSLHHQ